MLVDAIDKPSAPVPAFAYPQSVEGYSNLSDLRRDLSVPAASRKFAA